MGELLMVMTRINPNVLKAIEGEIAYAKGLGPDRTDGSKKSVGDYLTMLDTYLRAAQDGWTRNAGDSDALHEIRKLAAIAVRCLDEHGAPPRR